MNAPADSEQVGICRRACRRFLQMFLIKQVQAGLGGIVVVGRLLGALGHRHAAVEADLDVGEALRQVAACRQVQAMND